jgi:hypothetical protein
MHKQILTAALVAGSAVGSVAMAQGGPSTTIGSTVYADFSSISQQSADKDTAASGTGFDVKRAYLIFNHSFDDIWSANVTTDFRYTSADTDVYVKKAFLQAKFSDALVLRLGGEDTPWVPFVENLYGYRYVENVLIDRLKYGTSADWGFNANGKLANGLVEYSLSAVNGGGYKTPTRSKTVDFEGRVDLVPLKGLTIGVGGYDGKRDQETALKPALHTATRFDAIVDYANAFFQVGASYFDARDWNQVLVAATDEADGESVWASVHFAGQYSVFARYDHSEPSRTLNSALKDQYYNIGVSYSPIKNIDLALVYKNDSVDHGSLSTSNGTIGGTSTANNGRYSEIGVWTQIKF